MVWRGFRLSRRERRLSKQCGTWKGCVEMWVETRVSVCVVERGSSRGYFSFWLTVELVSKETKTRMRWMNKPFAVFVVAVLCRYTFALRLSSNSLLTSSIIITPTFNSLSLARTH